MALIIFAPVDMAILEKKIQQVFSAESKRELPARHPKDPVLDDQIKIGQLVDSGSKINRVAFLYRFKSEMSTTDESRRNGLIDYMTRNLLTQQIYRQRDVLPEHVRALSSTKGTLSNNVDILGFSVNVDEGFYHFGLKTLAQELERIRQQGFYQEDFDLAYQKVIETAESNKKAAKDRGSFWLVKIVEAVSLNKPLRNPQEKNNEVLELIKTVTLQDVNERLQAWLSSPDRLLYTQAVGGKRIDIGTPESIDKIFKAVRLEQFAPLEKAKTVEAKTLPIIARQGTASLLSRDESLGLSKWVLSNGDQLTLLNPQVLGDAYGHVSNDDSKKTTHFSAISASGYQVKVGSFWAEQIAQQMSEASGVRGWTDEEFQQWRREYGISLSSTHKAQSLTYRGRIADNKLDKMLGLYQQNQVVYDIDNIVYRTVMDNLKRDAGITVVRPLEEFTRQVAKARFGGKEDMTPTLSILDSLSHEYLEEVRQQQVSLPARYFIVSHLPEVDIIALVSRYLASIPRASKEYGEKVNGFDNADTTPVLQLPGQKNVDVALNIEPKAEYRLYAYQPFKWSPLAAVQMLYLGEHLENELNRRLRKEVQGVYSVRAILELDKDSNRAKLAIQYSSSPNRLDDLAEITEEVLAELADSITPEWANEVHIAFADIEANRLKTSFDSTLMHRLELSDTFYGDARYLKEMKKLTTGLTEEKLRVLAEVLTFENRVRGLYRPLKN
jgi:zinc protease